jgi:5-methylcytosine-specific restriction endonuclease McrA
VEYHWRHTTPYVMADHARVLRQHTGSQAKVISLVLDTRNQHGDSLADIMRDRNAWPRLVRKIEAVVKEAPLWKVANGRKGKARILYGSTKRNDTIELKAGVAYCFRQFYSLIQNAIRSAWLRDVRSMNEDFLGETLDLHEFLFGAERNALGAVRPVLMDLQRGECFYCGDTVRRDGGHIDHFIPWSKNPIDLGHKFVLSDSRCNSKKRDRMPHVDHLARWTERNREHGAEIISAVGTQLACDLPCTNRIAYWAYEQTQAAHGLTWLQSDESLALSVKWRKCFSVWV